MQNESRQRFVYKLALISTIASTTLFFVLALVEAYVRWTMNQSFTFLGGFGLESLAIAMTGLILGLIYSQRS